MDNQGAAATATATAGVASIPSSTSDEPLHIPQPLTSQPAKPALKKERTNFAEASAKSSSSATEKNLKWDEDAIEEHDLLRGTRMKIEEPNTPYTHYDSGSETDGSTSKAPKSPSGGKQHPTLSWDTLQTKLDSVAAVRDAYPSSPTHGENHDATKDQRNSDMKQLEFKEHRKRHYNEMELVRKFRQENPDADLLQGEDDGDADDENDS